MIISHHIVRVCEGCRVIRVHGRVTIAHRSDRSCARRRGSDRG